MLARLLDRGIGFEQIAAMTDRQISDLVFHRRNRHGEIEGRVEADPHEGLPLKEVNRRTLLATGKAANIPLEELQRIWREKYGDELLEES